ncbi:MAG: cytochrome P450 [Pseudomonadales bacterium]|jgi:cytochrome P450|uniref:Cytochrome P450 n=1 Tax=Pseudomonas abyssi TaxID=170540 RepID=A0A2A3MDG3_9PSED|nr:MULTISPECIES: cytochrome P450 [Pseudomonadaceae]MBP77563.1 cytochrome P450 [Pseudomonadales bacterium]MCC4262495.1 cytochrome P450 [Halopseudomonas aestusnigri]PBK02813.1 cytochrome P450 [Pseudomonas abyssi]|tara:strand:- start:8688 stop:9962 length:1275 start_codon:yes stop_codon:yes gene_type:complete
MSEAVKSDLEKVFADVASNYQGSDIDLHATYAKMRAETPVLEANFMEQLGVPSIAGVDPNRPCYTLFKYDDVMRVMRDSEQFTSGFIAEGLGAFFDGLILTAMDGDLHKSMRNLLQPVFLPETVNRWKEQRIDRVIREEFIKPMLPNKSADLMDFALYFPIRVIYSLIGFPEDKPEKIKQYAAWALAILAGPQVDPAKAEAAKKAAMEAVVALYDAIKEVVVQRRAEGAEGDDLISRLIRAEYEGRSLDDHEVTTFVRSLLPAAGETTTRTFGTLMVQLLENPDVLERVRADRGLVNKAIDESIRYEPVATFKVRQAANATEIRGVQIPKGAMVSCIVSSANRDEEAFVNADKFDIDRKPRPSFGFGFGPHMCIGQFVAKTEINCALNAILDLMPNLRLDPSKPAPKITGAQLRGPHELHVLWD